MTGPSQGDWVPSPGFWQHRPVAVTGATGLVGSHLLSMLVDLGADVVILLRDDIPPAWVGRAERIAVARGSVEDQGACQRMLAEYGVVTVFHLAAQGRASSAAQLPASTFETNIGGTWTVLEAVRRASSVSGVVLASTDEVYGEQRAVPCSEDTPIRPVQPHEVARACADLVATTYARSFEVPLVTGRCPTFFGPGDTSWDRLVPGAIRALLEGRRPQISSDGLLSRDYLYVIDGALAYLRLAEALAERPTLAGEVFNFSAERPLTVFEVVEMLQIGAGTHLEPDIAATGPEQTLHRYLSAAKAREGLGWRAGHTVEEAFLLTVRWYRDHLGLGAAAGA